MFDLAGFVPILRSDRAIAFTSDVIAQINKMLNTEHAMGSAYHPQSQGFVESRHQKLNRILASYASAHPERWVRWLPLAQWCLRATPLRNRSWKSPFEIITGMLPQGPIEDVFRRLEPGKFLDPGSCVRDLVDNLGTIHETIAKEMKAVHDEQAHRQALTEDGSAALKVGDYVVLKAPPQLVARAAGLVGSVSTRLLPRFRPQIYNIVKMASPQDAILAGPDSGSTNLGFSQPVHVTRIRRFDLADLDQPLSDGPLRIEVVRGSAWVRGDVLAQSATGKVKIKYDDDDGAGRCEWIDLASEEYRWLHEQPVDGAPSELAPVVRRRLTTKTKDGSGLES